MSDINRKRKRSISPKRNGVIELPHIPNVPASLVPQFLQALQRTSKFFAKHTQSSFTIVDWEKRNEGSSDGQNNINSNEFRIRASTTGNVHGDWMRRIESAAATAEQDSTADSDAQERQNDMQKAVEQWMEEVKHFARKKPAPLQSTTRNNDSTTSNSSHGPQPEIRERPSVPYAAFLYLWDMQQEHDRVAVRRATLFLSSLLLQKSKDCRQHLELESNLAGWVSNIVGDGVLWKNPDRSKKELPLLHVEAYATLSYLLENGFGMLYPKIGVAAKWLRHQSPQLESNEVATSTSMPELRYFRDLAIRYGKEEIRRVNKLIAKADDCLEILVPRMGVHSESLPSRGGTTGSNGVAQQRNNDTDDRELTEGNSSDEESDIEWEEGDNPKEKMACIDLDHESHISAVDRTMAVMQAAGATTFRGGELEIDLDAPVLDMQTGETATNHEQNALARKKLVKYMKQLTTRHLSRLTLWLDGLRNADGLVLQSGSSSLVSLPSKNASLRLDLLQQLSVAKQEVSRVLSSALRLNIDAEKTEAKDAEVATRPIGVSPGGIKNTRFHKLLRQARPKANRANQSSRIQIKCKWR
ncbi:hypothetical protein IV203_000576 [Nitzschia inconspicua]|uniref:Uncharacterized protein n=1 Tax=Nitzschia inconspicua TaxID=303405 RepID=A0A9K3L6M3_9STRA|nr:hypothetical protein IV203_000576 [Nitzschia inconspicua]